jgi:hypothetical protein
MKKVFFFIFFFFFLIFFLNFTSQIYAATPTYDWTKVTSGTGGDWGNSVITDASGNVYLTGAFYGTVDFNPSGTADNHTSNGDYDIFLTKINSDGSYGWTKTMGGTDWDYGYSVTTDASGNIYLTGHFVGTANFNPSGTADNHTSNGNGDIFFTKINSDGSYGWTKTMGGTDYDYGYSVTTDASGNVYLTGVFYGTVNFNPDGTDNHTSNGDYDIFLTKINSDGSYGWTKTMGGTDYDYGYSVTTDASGNVYLTGAFYGTVDFNPSGTADNHTSNGGYDIFFTKINSDGSYGWTKTMGGTDWDYGYSVTTDASGNIYLTGHFVGTANFNPSGLLITIPPMVMVISSSLKLTLMVVMAGPRLWEEQVVMLVIQLPLMLPVISI